MKTKITILGLALFATVCVNATTPASWSVLSSVGVGSEKGSVAWGDFNNDGYLDLFQLSNNVYALFKNNGDETFTNVTSTIMPAGSPTGINESGIIFLDYNNDGNLDLLTAGWSGSTSATLYKNSGAPNYTYTVDANNSLLGLRTGDEKNAHSILSAADYNNDGWVDLFMEGWCDALNTRVVTLYKNANGVFTRQTTPVGGTADFEGMNSGSIHTGDVNNDGYVDMISSGYSVSGSYKTNLYINQGNGTFVKSNATFTGIEQGESILFDANNDGWLDVYVAGVGYESNWVWPGNLYINNQNGTFTLNSNPNLASGSQGYTAFASGDINNDGKTDVMVQVPWGENTVTYYNNGDNTFLKDVIQNAGRARAGSFGLADFNNDNKLDYFIFGWRDGFTATDNTVYDSNWIGKFVKNTSAAANQAPSVPANIVATKTNGKYVITWDKSTDDITAQNAIRYNVYIQDQAGKQYAFSPANITTGRLKTGSVTLLSKNEITLDLAAGQYTVGVQAVDQANVASAFVSTSLSTTTEVENTLVSNVEVKPVNKKIEVRNSGAQGVNVAIMSLNGQLLYKGLCAAGTQNVLPVNLNQGIYLVKLSQDKVSRTVKVSVL
ncbi:MAG: T9SS type A sorting domain-containing protein [Paludibacter sp.]